MRKWGILISVFYTLILLALIVPVATLETFCHIRSLLTKAPISGGPMPESNVVIDLSHHNQNLDFASIRSNGGILGIIHKATQGLDYADPTYLPHRTSALANDLLWGAYHFGTGSDGVQQAQHFLDFVQPDAQTLLILDFEANGQGPSMTLEQARAFVTHVNEATGRWPGLYSDHYIKGLLGTNSDPSSPIAG